MTFTIMSSSMDFILLNMGTLWTKLRHNVNKENTGVPYDLNSFLVLVLV